MEFYGCNFQYRTIKLVIHFIHGTEILITTIQVFVGSGPNGIGEGG